MGASNDQIVTREEISAHCFLRFWQNGPMPMAEIDAVLDAVGPRLRALRRHRGITLADLATTTGISQSTLSRLESGQRRANLQLLLPLASAYGVPWMTW